MAKPTLRYFQDGGVFYSDDDDTFCIQDYSNMVKNDHDIAGAEKAHAEFVSAFSPHYTLVKV